VTSGDQLTRLEVRMPHQQSISPPSPARERELWKRFSVQRDPAAREELVRAYMPMARRMARRYSGVSEPYDDLLQVASLGLMNAVDRFDPVRGTPFRGFAKPTILGELKRHFRDKVWTIRVPRPIHDLMGQAEKATEELSLTLRRPPSIEELSRHLEAEPSDVLDALEAGHNRRPISLDAPPASVDGREPSPPEWLGVEEGGYELIEDRLLLARVLPGIDGRRREMLKLRFVDDLPQTQIAERLGCSQMQVSRTLRQTLTSLREAADRVDGLAS
jgi:RNA polymerase sigma-B factor